MRSLFPYQPSLQVVGPSLPALRRLAARLLHDPQSIWARKYFGASDVAPPSTWHAYVPPVRRRVLQWCWCVHMPSRSRGPRRPRPPSAPPPALQCGGPGCAAWGWGNNLFGELGDGTTTDRWAPVRSAPGRGYVAINAGKDFTCALLPSGGADCFGQNNWGQLGDGTLATSRPTPAPVETNGSVYTALACGDSHACSLLADGGAACWGMNSYGNLGIGDAAKKYNLVPVRVQAAPGSIYVAISAAGRHTCALRAEGAADCWVSV